MAQLLTETNTPAVEKRITRAVKAHAIYGHEHRARFHCAFEHGQWWVVFAHGATYSVCDAAGGPAVLGFGFEQVSRGDEE